ncbi:hypothetical protein [Bacteriophage Phobos]|uniref:DUF3310 domain-containing protein n=1 Tax=Bacteriophage Phobos TaxID=2662138 RepID=A0A5Q2U764_9CAUD|nr:nucleotide kinase [Bacteriophage Phobos]QGH45020.1 hypothetical protein [Bacteriophage Phobos]
MTETTNNPLDVQVGGGHYKKLKLQPIQVAMHNGFDACTFAIMKYTMRYGDKNGPEDIRKAIHFIDLREETLTRDENVCYPTCVYTAEELCKENGYEGHQAAALKYLWDWFYGTMPVTRELAHRLHFEAAENRERLRGALHCMLDELLTGQKIAAARVQNEMDEARADAIGQNGNDGEHYDHIHQRFQTQE